MLVRHWKIRRMRKMKFSVVIPLFNKKKYIQNTIESVLKQTYQNFEIIVVDDGSSDGSAEQVRLMQSDKIHLICQENQGVAVARNTGIYHAAGTFISFLDADDTWNEDYLETVDALTEEYPQSDIFVTAYAVDMGNGKVNYSTQLEPEKGCLDSYWLTLAKGYDFVWTSVTTIRKDALLKAGCFKPGEKIGQDLDTWARVARNNPKVAYSSKICARYNRAAEGNARTRVKIAWAEAFIKDLEEEMENPARSTEEKASIQCKYDKKMTVYIFTCLLAGEKKRAAIELKNWKGKPNRRNVILRFGLWIAKLMPTWLNRWIYNIRLKVF